MLVRTVFPACNLEQISTQAVRCRTDDIRQSWYLPAHAFESLGHKGMDEGAAKRRAILSSNPKLSSDELCELFDHRQVPVPTRWKDAGIEWWTKAFHHRRFRSRVQNVISHDRTRNPKRWPQRQTNSMVRRRLDDAERTGAGRHADWRHRTRTAQKQDRRLLQGSEGTHQSRFSGFIKEKEASQR